MYTNLKQILDIFSTISNPKVIASSASIRKDHLKVSFVLQEPNIATKAVSNTITCL